MFEKLWSVIISSRPNNYKCTSVVFVDNFWNISINLSIQVVSVCKESYGRYFKHRKGIQRTALWISKRMIKCNFYFYCSYTVHILYQESYGRYFKHRKGIQRTALRISKRMIKCNFYFYCSYTVHILITNENLRTLFGDSNCWQVFFKIWGSSILVASISNLKKKNVSFSIFSGGHIFKGSDGKTKRFVNFTHFPF